MSKRTRKAKKLAVAEPSQSDHPTIAAPESAPVMATLTERTAERKLPRPTKQRATNPIRGLGGAKTRPHARNNNANEGSEPGRSTPANASTSSPVTASAEPAAPQTPGNSLNISKPKYDPEHKAAHLREHQFKPGESGNPSGRPKGIFGRAALRRLLRPGKDGEPRLVEVIDAQIDKAIRRHSTQAAGFLRECVDGKPATSEANYIGSVNVQLNVEMPWAQQPAPIDTVAVTQRKSDSGS